MMGKIKVLIVGATGETGGSVTNGLLEDPNFVCAGPFLFFFSFFLELTLFSLSRLSSDPDPCTSPSFRLSNSAG